MYYECISCKKLGVSCPGPNFSAMEPGDLLEWCKYRKTYLRLTNAKLAELSYIPKGTIDRLFSGDVVGFHYETIRMILKALGGSFTGNRCPDPDGYERLQLEVTVTRQNELILQQKESIQMLEDEKQKMYDFFQAQNKAKTRWIIFLGLALGVILIVMVIILLLFMGEFK